jgi:hypothetical protein
MLRGTRGWRRMRAFAFERENHLMDGGRSDAEVFLDVGFGGRASVDAGVGIDEGEVLALLGGEAGSISARHLIHLSIHLGLQRGGSDECTLSGGVDPV